MSALIPIFPFKSRHEKKKILQRFNTQRQILSYCKLNLDSHWMFFNGIQFWKSTLRLFLLLDTEFTIIMGRKRQYKWAIYYHCFGIFFWSRVPLYFSKSIQIRPVFRNIRIPISTTVSRNFIPSTFSVKLNLLWLNFHIFSTGSIIIKSLQKQHQFFVPHSKPL